MWKQELEEKPSPSIDLIFSLSFKDFWGKSNPMLRYLPTCTSLLKKTAGQFEGVKKTRVQLPTRR